MITSMMHSPDPSPERANTAVLNRWAIIAGLVVSSLVAAGFTLWNYPAVVAGLIGALILGYFQPQIMLILAIGWLPSTNSLAGGDHYAKILAAFSTSDFLFFAALPGIVRHALLHRTRPALGSLTLPIMLYLAAGVVSFALNLREMQSDAVYYLVGFLRTLQVVLLLPMSFRLFCWPKQALGLIAGTYLLGIAILTMVTLATFRFDGAYRDVVMGNQKNMAGLIMATGLLILLSILTQPQSAVTSFQKWFLTGLAVFGAVAFGTLLARSSVLCFLLGALYLACARRRIALCLAVSVIVIVSLIASQKVVGTASASLENANPSVRGRVLQWDYSIASIRAHPLFGDGFQARRKFNPHNVVLTLLTENGIVGFALFLWVLITQARLLLRSRQELQSDPVLDTFCIALIACWVAVMVHAQFDPFWRRGPLWLPWAGTGILLSLRATRNQPTRP